MIGFSLQIMIYQWKSHGIYNQLSHNRFVWKRVIKKNTTTQNEQFIVGFWSFRRNVQTNPDWDSGRVYKDVGNPGSTDTLQVVSIRIMWVLVTQPRIQFELLWDRYTKSKVLKGAFLNKHPDQLWIPCAENPSEFIKITSKSHGNSII